jgi:hypothetical protein
MRMLIVVHDVSVGAKVENYMYTCIGLNRLEADPERSPNDSSSHFKAIDEPDGRGLRASSGCDSLAVANTQESRHGLD